MPWAKANSAIGVGRKLTSRTCFSHHASNVSGSRISDGEGRTSVAPAQSADQISHVEASNPKPATLDNRCPGPRSNVSRYHATRLTNPRCSITTPLGFPVEPEVYMTYAAWRGSTAVGLCGPCLGAPA